MSVCASRGVQVKFGFYDWPCFGWFSSSPLALNGDGVQKYFPRPHMGIVPSPDYGVHGSIEGRMCSRAIFGGPG
jgi:hypothetical protein